MKILKENRKIIDTHHSIDQFMKRYNTNNISKDRVVKVIQDGIDKIIKDYKDEATHYGVWSKTGICVIIDWRRDKLKPTDKNNHAVIVTLPPIQTDYNKFFTKVTDTRVIVETALFREIEDSLFSMVDKTKLEENKKLKHYNEIEFNGLTMYAQDGHLYDSQLAYCFIVD